MAKKNAGAARIKWLDVPEDHDYTAAGSYLSLLYDPDQVSKMVLELKAAPMTEFKGKDIFRACQLSLLGISNFHVDTDRKKIKKGQALSPLLLVRDAHTRRVVIADGYHRLCAVYGFDEDSWIKCKIV